eukprot:gene52750-45083_t
MLCVFCIIAGVAYRHSRRSRATPDSLLAPAPADDARRPTTGHTE